MSATVQTSAIFLNDAEDPADFIKLTTIGDAYSVTPQKGGGVDHDYASGRSRSWMDESDVTEVGITLRGLTAEQIAWLTAHRGRTVCFRDHLSRKVFGVYFAVPVEVDTSARSIARDNGQLSLVSVTFSEAGA